VKPKRWISRTVTKPGATSQWECARIHPRSRHDKAAQQHLQWGRGHESGSVDTYSYNELITAVTKSGSCEEVRNGTGLPTFFRARTALHETKRIAVITGSKGR